MDGWIIIHRKLIDASWFNKSEYVHLWLYLLLKANHKDKEIFVGNEKVLVKRGELLTSRHKLSEVVHIQENKIYRILKCFENEHQIEQRKTKKYTVISIVNYDMYQKNEQDSEQQMNNKRTTNEQPMNTNNNDNNDNNNIYTSKKILMNHFSLTWKKYPNKKGRAKALEYYLQWIRGRAISGEKIKLTDKQIYYAVCKYAKECENIEQQFIKHGDTFFNKAILDYVEFDENDE